MRTYFDTDSLKVGMLVVYDCSAGLNSCGVTYYLTKVTKTYVEGYSIIGDKRGDIKKITKPKLVRCFPSNQLCRHCEEKPILRGESLCRDCFLNNDDEVEDEKETKYTCEECGTHDEDEVGISTGTNGIEKRVCECCDIDGSNYSGWGEDK
jgi:hypothetical protein